MADTYRQLFLMVGFLVTMLMIGLVVAFGRDGDGFVRMLEARQGIYPGQTKVLPECNCTIRYVGTFVRGKRYTVVIDKLD